MRGNTRQHTCNTGQRAATHDNALQHRAARVRRRYRAELQRVNEAMRELEDELEVVKNTLAKCAQVPSGRSRPGRPRVRPPAPGSACGRGAGPRAAARGRDVAQGGPREEEGVAREGAQEAARDQGARGERVRAANIGRRPPARRLFAFRRSGSASRAAPTSGRAPASLPRIVRRHELCIHCACALQRNSGWRESRLVRSRVYVRRCLHQYMCLHVDRDSSIHVRARRCRDSSIYVRARRCRCRCRGRCGAAL